MFTSANGNLTLVIANQKGSFYSRYNVMLSGGGLSLIFNSSNYSTDQGIYTCTGAANGKSISSSANVNVLCKCYHVSTHYHEPLTNEVNCSPNVIQTLIEKKNL